MQRYIQYFLHKLPLAATACASLWLALATQAVAAGADNPADASTTSAAATNATADATNAAADASTAADTSATALPPLADAQKAANAALEATTAQLRGKDVLLPIGAAVPAFALYDQDARPLLAPETWRGKFVVVSFIFTRCQVATMCPAATARMVQLQRQLANSDLSDKVQLVSITFDPRYDTPAVLRQYAQLFGADTDSNYSLLTGSPAVIEALLRRFGMLTLEQNGTINHTMTTTLIAPDGTIAARQRGADWSIEPFLEQIRTATTR